jgi:putative hydrolase of the HAD superfamily
MQDRIRAICFDLDNTLWDVDVVIPRAEARLREWLAQHAPRIAAGWSTEAMRSARVALAAEEPERAHDLTWLRTESLARHAEACGYPRSVAQAAFDEFFAARNEVEVYGDVLPALERLAGRFRLGALTNGNADLRRIGLARHFTVTLTAREAGAAKPHRLAFQRLAGEIGCAPHEILHAGDDPYADVDGARRAGFRTAWVNRRGLRWPEDLPPADIEARDVAHLAERLTADSR